MDPLSDERMKQLKHEAELRKQRIFGLICGVVAGGFVCTMLLFYTNWKQDQRNTWVVDNEMVLEPIEVKLTLWKNQLGEYALFIYTRERSGRQATARLEDPVWIKRLNSKPPPSEDPPWRPTKDQPLPDPIAPPPMAKDLPS